MLKNKKAITQTNKQFRKTDMPHGAKCTSKTSTKNRNTHFAIKQTKQNRNSTGQKPKAKY